MKQATFTLLIALLFVVSCDYSRSTKSDAKNDDSIGSSKAKISLNVNTRNQYVSSELYINRPISI